MPTLRRSTVEIDDIEYEIAYYAYKEQRATDVDPGEDASIHFDQVLHNNVDIWWHLSDETCQKLEDKLWEVLNER